MSGDRTAGGRSRAQTAQDFAVGIGLFLLAVAFVFAFVPEVLAPYDAGSGASEASQADRAATLLVSNLSVDDRPNELDAERTGDYFAEIHAAPDEAEEIRNRTGLPFSARVNVTVAEVDGPDDQHATANGTRLAAGAHYRENAGGRSATRIVRTNEPGTCEPACRLVVRVW